MTSTALRYLYCALFAGGSALTLAGQHRLVFGAFASLSVPSLPASALTAVLNLSWYELAYSLGRASNSALVFAALPFVGCGLGIFSGALVLGGSRFAVASVIVNLALGIFAAAAVLIAYRWHGDVIGRWRLVNAAVFLAANSAWLACAIRR